MRSAAVHKSGGFEYAGDGFPGRADLPCQHTNYSKIMDFQQRISCLERAGRVLVSCGVREREPPLTEG
jgi:hypothetical protein